MVLEVPEVTYEEQTLYDMTDDELYAAVRTINAPTSTTTEDNSDDTDNSTPDEVVSNVDTEEDDNSNTDGTNIEADNASDETVNGTTPEDSSENDTVSETEVEDEQLQTTQENDSKQPTDTADVTKPASYTVKANGGEYQFSVDELIQLAPKAMDYTKKMQELAPWRRTISALKEHQLTHEDVSLLIDVMKGDKGAIAAIARKAKVDLLDVDVDNSTYSPKEYGKSERELAINDVVDSIHKDPEFSTTQRVLQEEWDDKSREAFVDNPSLINDLHTDVKSGVYAAVAPMAHKLKVLDGATKSDLDYYVMAGQQYYAQLEATNSAAEAQRLAAVEQANKAAQSAKQQAEVAKAKAVQAKHAEVSQQADARKAAAPTTKSAGGKKSVVDYLDESDEAYEEWYNKLQAKY